MKRVVKFKVKGSIWTAVMLIDEKYDERFIEDAPTVSMCVENKKHIFFKETEFLKSNVLHELLHAFVSETNVRSADLNPSQMEELACEIVGEHCGELDKIATKIFKALSKKK
jgi:hypothetical protein